MYVSQNLSMSSLKMSSLPWHQLMKGKNMQRMGMVRTVWSIATFVTIVLNGGQSDQKFPEQEIKYKKIKDTWCVWVNFSLVAFLAFT